MRGRDDQANDHEGNERGQGVYHRANALLTDHEASQFMEYSGNSKTGSLRRQSMELTRALAEMRKVAR